MFPTVRSIVDRNEAGEVTGWDNPSEDPAMDYYCDTCGFSHAGDCFDIYDNGDDDDYEDDNSTLPNEDYCNNCESLNCRCYDNTDFNGNPHPTEEN